MTDKTVIATGMSEASVAAIDAAKSGMTASNDVIGADDGREPVSVGAWLRMTREAQGLSPGDIASKLRMGSRQVMALEASDFAALPTGTFLRGFVRNYAKALALDADAVLALLEKTHNSASAIKATPVVVPAQQNITMPTPGGELATPKARAAVVGLVVLLLAAACWYWWEYVRPHLGEGGRAKSTPVETSVPAPIVQPSTTAAVPANATDGNAATPVPASPPVDTAPVPADVPVAMEQRAAVTAPTMPSVVASATAPLQEKVVPAPAPVSPVKGASVLGFTFQGDSWVEVTDGAGKIVLSKRFKAGDAEEINGRVPLSVVIGNAQVTRMAHNGKEFDLAPYTRVSVARVTVK